MYYYQIAPLTYVGTETSLLTYTTENKISVGSLVEIPLRNRTVLGVAVKECEKPSFTTREISSVLYEKPVLTAHLLELAFWISDYYSASLVSVLATMIPSGITKKRRKSNLETDEFILESPHRLTEDQKTVLKDILHNPDEKHLLFGATGSGKTEIYMQAIAETIKKNGQQAIVLVPEVSLTPQTFERFQKRFGDKVTLLHSYLKETERFSNWKEIYEGNKQIVVGSRSALFAPFDNLGLIVIDEEHETSYKQDKTPRYQTVTVAAKLAKLSGAGLILGSATPQITTFYDAIKGRYQLHTLNKRIVQTNLPPVEIVDMRNEFKLGNKSIFSDILQKEIRAALAKNKQIILFLNRRGMSTFISCRDCGHVEKCPKCDIPLTFHLNTSGLECHHCGFKKVLPTSCPECKSFAIKYFGTGTERVEQEITKLFGNDIVIARMDRDTTKSRGSHEEMYKNFAQNKANILIGTQMVTKGFDLSNVGLVGVISADTLLNFPDYTAHERTFNLLTQVAGRTGRGQEQGNVIIQTYNPDNFAIRFASRHDYEGFYKSELENRKELNYPPFAKLIKLVYNNVVQEKAKSEAEKLFNTLSKELKMAKIDFQIIGPSPAFIPKKSNKYYYQMTLKIIHYSEESIFNTVKLLQRLTSNDWSVDVEPGDLL